MCFRDCKSLTSITIPYSVTSIGVGAFLRCGNLTNITIPDSVTNIEEDAFKDCDNLCVYTVKDSYVDKHFKETYPKIKVVYD